MAGARNRRYTIYDAMEEKGVFASNPANADARDGVTGQSLYTGPQEYPKMLYHPTGDERQITPGEDIQTPYGPKTFNLHFEMISVTVDNKEQEEHYLAEGWRLHPTRVSGGNGPENRVAELEAELARLKNELAQQSVVVASQANLKVRKGNIARPDLKLVETTEEISTDKAPDEAPDKTPDEVTPSTLFADAVASAGKQRHPLKT